MLELHFFYAFFYFVRFVYLFQNYRVDRLKREMRKISIRDKNKKNHIYLFHSKKRWNMCLFHMKHNGTFRQVTK